MGRPGIVSAEEIRRRIAASGGDIQDSDIQRKLPIPFVPTPRTDHEMTREDLVQEYERYITAVLEVRGNLQAIPEDRRSDYIRQRAEHAAAAHYEN
jgi:hypothetical protein|nr:MAG TPA: hypothetical protein [Caudoviricetes sp.]